MRKGKARIDRIIILILTGILVFGLLGFGIYKLFGLFFNDKPNNEDKPIVVETTDGVKVSINDYVIYRDQKDEIGFNFIIAELNFEANNQVSFELKNLQTSEKINLNDITKYINKMELAGYNTSKLEITTQGITSSENKTTAKIFIPFNTDADNLSVYNAIDASKIEFDLTKNNYLVTSLKLEDTNTQIEVGTTKVSITNAYISDFMLHNDVQYELGSTQKVYSFEITVSKADDHSKITDAIYIVDGTDEEIRCLGREYKSIDMNNIIDTDLSLGTKGGLFFVVYSTDNTVNEGTLLIKFSNEDKWIEIEND